MSDYIYVDGELYHHGIKGMKWGIRRYQNPDGSLTAEGKKRYGDDGDGSPRKTREEKKAAKAAAKEAKKNSPEAIEKRLKREETLEKGKEFIRQNGKTIAMGVGTAAAIALGMSYLTPVINSAANVRLATSNKMDRLDAMESVDYTTASREASAGRASEYVRDTIGARNRGADGSTSYGTGNNYTSNSAYGITGHGKIQNDSMSERLRDKVDVHNFESGQRAASTASKQSRLDAMESNDYTSANNRAQQSHANQQQVQAVFDKAGRGEPLSDADYAILRREYVY